MFKRGDYLAFARFVCKETIRQLLTDNLDMEPGQQVTAEHSAKILYRARDARFSHQPVAPLEHFQGGRRW